jgi:hypothetical protein
MSNEKETIGISDRLHPTVGCLFPLILRKQAYTYHVGPIASYNPEVHCP